MYKNVCDKVTIKIVSEGANNFIYPFSSIFQHQFLDRGKGLEAEFILQRIEEEAKETSESKANENKYHFKF